MAASVLRWLAACKVFESQILLSAIIQTPIASTDEIVVARVNISVRYLLCMIRFDLLASQTWQYSSHDKKKTRSFCRLFLSPPRKVLFQQLWLLAFLLCPVCSCTLIYVDCLCFVALAFPYCLRLNCKTCPPWHFQVPFPSLPIMLKYTVWV